MSDQSDQLERLVGERLEDILSAKWVRRGAQFIFEEIKKGRTHFHLHLSRMPEVMKLVENEIEKRYPDWNIPYHSRWGHFKVGNIPRLDKLSGLSKQSELNQLFTLQLKWDLVIISVLLDAGAGTNWKYQEGDKSWNRSEGLAVASFHMFKEGLFSSSPETDPWRVDSVALKEMTLEKLSKGMQVGPGNELVGIEGRLHLLKELGHLLEKEIYFKPLETNLYRPSNFFHFMNLSQTQLLAAPELLKVVLRAFHGIWPSRIVREGINLGDVWSYQPLNQLIPFHKLSQWLTYSLLEPLEEYGIKVTDLDGLTGLAEYRNGGLFVDAGVLELKDKNQGEIVHSPSSELIIEWRAMTIILLDELIKNFQQKYQKTSEELPLTKILEGGTWHAGRTIAFAKRPGGEPPLKIAIDGTFF